MKKSIVIISVIAGIFVGLLVTTQFRSAPPVSSSYPLEEIEAQNELIKSYTDEQGVLKSRIVSLRSRIDEAIEQNQMITQNANIEKLNELKRIIGLTDLSGDGFIVQLDDSPFIDRENLAGEEGGYVYAADLRDMVNLLRANNVDGIAINDQRIISTTSINSVGSTILVNNSKLSPPFSIKVVGDYESFVRRISEPSVLSDLQKRVRENGIQFEIKQSPHVILPIYNGQFRLKFLTSASETP